MKHVTNTCIVARGPFILWLTGLSGAGKSNLAKIVRAKLIDRGLQTFTIDADDLRNGLNRGLGYSRPDFVESTRRIAHVSKLMMDAGLVAIAVCISPYREGRAMARALAPDRFIEVFVDVPVEVAKHRSELYRLNVPGIVDSPYERPVSPEIRIDSGSPRDGADKVLSYLLRPVQQRRSA